MRYITLGQDDKELSEIVLGMMGLRYNRDTEEKA